ncbi:MAG: serine/threonine-protein phosphatase, partial [Aquificota bacterium]
MRLKVCYFTHRGYRSKNEDALLIDGLVLQEELMEEVECISFFGGGLFAVADGLGGHRG